MKKALEQAIGYRSLLDKPHKLFMANNVEREANAPEERTVELLCAYCMFGEQNIFGINTSGNTDTFGVDRNILKDII